MLMLILLGSCVNGRIGDYHPSSSAAFDEGKLSSISRFYPIGTICYYIHEKGPIIEITKKIIKCYFYNFFLFLRNTNMPV